MKMEDVPREQWAKTRATAKVGDYIVVDNKSWGDKGPRPHEVTKAGRLYLTVQTHGWPSQYSIEVGYNHVSASQVAQDRTAYGIEEWEAHAHRIELDAKLTSYGISFTYKKHKMSSAQLEQLLNLVESWDA